MTDVLKAERIEAEAIVLRAPDGSRIELGADASGQAAIVLRDSDGRLRARLAAGVVRLCDARIGRSVEVYAIDETGCGLMLMDASLSDPINDSRVRAEVTVDPNGDARVSVVDAEGRSDALRAEDPQRAALHRLPVAELRRLLAEHQAALAAEEQAAAGRAFSLGIEHKRRWVHELRQILEGRSVDVKDQERAPAAAPTEKHGADEPDPGRLH